ncbi:MAG: aspartate/glutamate racemase family protein [Roseovarius sp.]
MKYDLDLGAGQGTRLGLIVLATDETLEWEVRGTLARHDLNLLHARIPARADVTPEDLRSMAPEMTRTAALLPRDLSVVGYGCTSASAIIGAAEVSRLIQEAHPGTPVTNPLGGVVAALRALGATRVAMVTPYVAEVSAPMRRALADHGIEVVAAVSFDQHEDWTVARIAEASTQAAMLEVGRAPGVQAIFTSCTNLRTFNVIESVEEELGLPVVSSNQALLWDMLRLAGVAARGWGPGRLFDLETLGERPE